MKGLALSILLASLVFAQNDYCKLEYANTPQNCEKFQFDQVVSDEQRCGKDKIPHKIQGVSQTNCTTFYDISDLPSQDIDASTMRMAQLITNVFENGDTQMGYAAANDIGDCRGYTCGYIGFTTGTNDAYAVIQHYGKVTKRRNRFARYMEALKTLSSYEFDDPRRADTSQLKGFAKVWKDTACKDPAFVQAQLDVGHAMYLKPALKYAASVDVRSNLGKAVFYDTIVQHGWQYVEPLINLPRLLSLTGPRGTDDEQTYLNRFLTTRRQLACCYPGKVWNDSSDRMYNLQKLVADWDQNKNLAHPVHLKVFNVTVTGKESIAFDTAHCPPSSSPLPPPQDLPIPQCPA